MLCSAKELGLSDDASGLVALDGALAPGDDLRRALALDDAILTLKLTPNRADCLSMLGVARDVAALSGARLARPDVAPVPASSHARRAVRVEEPEACPRFGGRTLEGIDATRPTPAWMKARLERAGLRSISAVVDVTNYVMLELGQPMHAYDERHLDGSLVVRFARAGEKLTLLNGDVLDLEPDLLLVVRRERSRWASPASWAASIRASATTPRASISRPPTGIPRSCRDACGASASRATPATASSAASTPRSAPRRSSAPPR